MFPQIDPQSSIMEPVLAASSRSTCDVVGFAMQQIQALWFCERSNARPPSPDIDSDEVWDVTYFLMCITIVGIFTVQGASCAGTASRGSSGSRSPSPKR